MCMMAAMMGCPFDFLTMQLFAILASPLFVDVVKCGDQMLPVFVQLFVFMFCYVNQDTDRCWCGNAEAIFPMFC